MRSLLLPFLVLTLLGSCTEPTQGMFYSIEKETKTGDSSNALPNTVTVMGTAVRTGTDSALYLAANSLYRKTATKDWERVTPVISGVSAPVILDTAALGSTLYIIAASDGVKKIYSSAAGLDFTQVSSGTLEGSPAGLIPVSGDGDRLLVSWSTPEDGFQLYLLDNTGLKSTALLPLAASKGVVQAALTPSGYYAVSPSFLYKGTDLTAPLNAEALAPGGISAGNLGGLAYTAALNNTGTKEVVVSTSRGTLLREVPAPGTGWEVYPGTAALSISGSVVELGSLAEWSTGGTPDLVLLAGAFKLGYVEAWFASTAETPSAVLAKTEKTVDSVGFTNSQLGKKTVTGFQVFDGNLYAESASGFWKYSNRGWGWE